MNDIMKKILLYLDAMSRDGAERVMANIANYLADDYQIALINDISFGAENEYPLDERVKRYCLGFVGGGIKGNLKRIKMLRGIIKAERPDVILSFKGACNLRMLVAAKGLKIRKIVSVRNDPNYEYGRGLVKLIAKLLFRSASGCVFQTQEAMDYFQNSVRKKSVIIWNPVADKFFKRSWTPLGEEIVVVGRLVPQKNPLLALEAFRLIFADHPETRLTYYGSGELKDQILSKVESYGLDDKVRIIDNVPNIEDYLCSARLFLMTSDFEGMPNALMEAMTVGVPCVATDCPCGGPKAISDGFNEEMLVPCKDAKAIAQKAVGLLEDEEKQRELSQKERDRSSLFETERVMKQWEDFLFKL